MLSRTDLRRSVAGMAIDLQRKMETRKHATDDYKAAEREQQFQFDISGTIGTLPTEHLFKLYFDMLFVMDAGMHRDSQLSQPLVKTGFEITSGPAGLILYAHVTNWLYTDDLHYKGAEVKIGSHSPGVMIQGAGSTQSRQWTGVFHVAFQGYALPRDSDDPEMV